MTNTIVGWNLSDLKNKKLDKGKVFSCFSCAGGSTMGYKLAGFDVIGCCEIDKKMLEIYKLNHKPRLPYLASVADFANKTTFEKELYELDILDGSPPCSSFSLSGSREKTWGKNKMFREGQSEQILDELFFHFIKLGKKLQPKVIIAENVKGIIMGHARSYVKKINQAFTEAGYIMQVFLVNATTCGVPQKRERVFFIAVRNDLYKNKINLNFNMPIVTVGEAFKSIDRKTDVYKKLIPSIQPYYKTTLNNKSIPQSHNTNSFFNYVKISSKTPSPTVLGRIGLMHYSEPRFVSSNEIIRLQTFPDDFNFIKKDPVNVNYICGMSVPPLMMKSVSEAVYNQILCK